MAGINKAKYQVEVGDAKNAGETPVEPPVAFQPFKPVASGRFSLVAISL